MNLLPKTHEDFSKKDYWESFFKKRGTKAFEWYGEYPELCGNLHKYIKTKDNTLVVGCGNSSLSSDLYDVGYNNITNIDISQVVINQMLNLHEKTRPNLKYIQMDVFKMSFEDEAFTVVLDKGTLDALMPDESSKNVETINNYFKEVERVLKVGGRFICISLLQSHILNVILSYFPSQNWMVRIVRCLEAEQKSNENDNSLPIFMVICTKFKALPQMVLEVNMSLSSKMQRVETVKDVQALISGIQHTAFICAGLRRSNISNDDDFSFDLFKPEEKIPRYTIYVVDLPFSSKNSQYAAFVVPQGREVEWMFSTNKGRTHLAALTKHNRLAVIVTHRGQTYTNLEDMQNELHEAVCQIAPSGVTGKIPFLSLGNDVGSRVICYQSNSLSSGDYVVEDVEIDKSKFRRLLYLNSQLGTQSEAKLKSVKNRKGVTKEVVDHTFVSCKYHSYMSIAVQLAAGNSEKSVAIIGLGGGGLCMFLRKFVPRISITAVDIDDDMLSVAVNWFGFKEDQKLNVLIIDGIRFLENCVNDGKKFDAILFDIDNKKSTIGLSFPPKEFLLPSVLDNVKKCLHDDGLFILNLVLRDESLRPEILGDIKQTFKTIATYKLEEDLNELVTCSSIKLEEAKLKLAFKDSCNKLNNFFKSNHDKNNLIEVESFINELTIDTSETK